MAGFTNKGKALALEIMFNNAGAPTNFYVALMTSATAPDADTNTISDLTEIAAGNGYTTGGISLTRNSTDFDALAEVDASDWGHIEIKDLVWTASGGAIPGSGNGARYAVVTDDNVTIGSREIYAYFDLSSDQSVTDGNTLTLSDFIIRATET